MMHSALLYKTDNVTMGEESRTGHIGNCCVTSYNGVDWKRGETAFSNRSNDS